MSDLIALLSEMFCAQIIQVTFVILLVGLVTRLLLRPERSESSRFLHFCRR